MGGPSSDGRDYGSDASPRLAETVRRFESALQASLKGGSPPVVEQFVSAAAESERDQIRERLLGIELQWRQRHAPPVQGGFPPAWSAIKSGDTDSVSPAPTIDAPPFPTPPASDAASTVTPSPGMHANMAPPPSAAKQNAGQQQHGAETGDPRSLAGSDATIDLPRAGVSGKTPSSDEPEAGADGATGVWTPNDPDNKPGELAFTVDQVPDSPEPEADAATGSWTQNDPDNQPGELAFTVDQAPDSPEPEANAATGAWTPNDPDNKPGELAFTVDQAPRSPRRRRKSSRPTVPGYELLSELGRGGMGVVYKAVQTKLNRMVALKMVLAGEHASPDQLARFATEAEAVAALQHPNIVQIYEVGEQNGLPFFSLEYVDGQPLDKRLAGKPHPPREAARLMEQIARAMLFAHEHGIMHRDLKPANVLLTADGIPKVTDFGLAKKLEGDSSQTKSGTLMGTPSYMAPEQARGEVHLAGPAADIHSLGAMLYEMLVGRPPYLGSTPLDTMMQVIHSEPVPPRKLMPRLSRDIETICLKCLQKEPRQRYATCGELADDLLGFQKGEPIRARPISRPERAWRWCRRNPRTASLSAAVFILLATASLAMGKLALDASQQRQLSEEARKLAGQQIKQAETAVSGGDARRALDLLSIRDVRLSTTPDLADVLNEWNTLESRVRAYAEFKRLLAEAQFAGLSGNREDRLKARELLQKLLKLYADIRDGAAGLPPLDARQRELFREAQFNALFLAAFVEEQLSLPKDPANPAPEEKVKRKEALQRAIGWQNEAAKLFPETKALYLYRALNWGGLGNPKEKQADLERAESIAPTSAVDHFWHGFAEVLRAQGAKQSGNDAESQERYRNAIAEYASYLQINPRDSWGFIQWAACHFQLREFDDALVGYSSVIDIDPGHAMAYVNRGIVELNLKKVDDALGDFARALALDDHCADAYYNRAVAALNRQDFEAALRDLNRAIEYKPTSEGAWLMRADAYRNLKRFEEGLADLDHLIEFARNPVAVRLMRANLLFELERDPEAEADYDAILDHAPDNVEALRKRAELRQKLDRVEEALQDLNEVLRIEPDDVQSLSRRVKLKVKLKHDDAALDDYSRLIELQHNLPANYRARAKLYRQRGDRSEAIDDYRELVKLEPNNAEAWRWLALIEFNLAITESNAKQFAAARADASEVIRLRPEWALPYQIRAFVNLAEFKEFDNSLADWRKFAELKPEDAKPHYWIGRIEMGRRHYAEAVAELKQAIALKPDHVDAHWALAETFLFLKRYDEALNETNLLIDELAKNRPAAINSRGDVFRAMGKPQDAAANYLEFFNRRPLDLNDEYFGEYSRAANSAAASLAALLDLQGKSDDARACFDKLVAANPGSAPALLERAQDRRNQSRFEEAWADCEAAARIDDKSLLPGLAKASIVAARGDHAAAVAEAEKLLARAPSDKGRVLWAAARVWSLASAAAQSEAGEAENSELAAAYADRAADLLADALGRGFLDLVYPEQNRLPLDPALAAVRHHPRVEELLGE